MTCVCDYARVCALYLLPPHACLQSVDTTTWHAGHCMLWLTAFLRARLVLAP